MIESKLRQTSSLIDSIIKNCLNEADIVYRAAYHLPSHGGKRLRPFLVIKSCELVGGNFEKAIFTAAAVELLHNFTLIHDDIMDNDSLRRGIPTVHTLWGIPMGILAGDMLFAKAFQVLLSSPNVNYDCLIKAAKIMADATVTICEGQSLDMAFEARIDVSEEEYLTMIYKKTGALFKACAEIGGLIGGGDETTIELLGRYGGNLGIGFQIFDDYLGIFSREEVLGKPIGSDIREGKKTLIVIKALSSKLREDILRILGKKNISDQEIRKLIDGIKQEGIDEYTLDKAKRYIKMAIDSIAKFPESEAKYDLIELANYAISRVK
ncbi:MAG: polyprenyl synthetase family protein [Candidatus Methanomethyliaceae archaeon]|nr:polyprenyl synthetase family protein [Candidatus Methanomethyliaceae archaeon]MDW7970379.1 polyprenyl synthetase family protein [Nitrososphaerota archaeon]